MIVVWGPPGDETTLVTLDALERRGAPVVFIDQAQVLSHTVRLTVDRELRAWLELPSGAVDLREVSAAYVRPHDSADAPAVSVNGADSAEALHARQVDDLLLRWAEITPALVINRPSAMASNDSKPSQMLTARAVGFHVPETVLTTDPEAVMQFAAAHEAVIYKSISSIRSIVTRLQQDDIDRLDDVRWCPTQLQELVPGTDVRAHVVGDRVFACEIESRADDYRYGDATMQPYELPAEQATRCVALAARLGLDLAGIDLRRSQEQRWYCFEANPSPAFACFGAEIRHAVADAVAERLIAAPAARPFPSPLHNRPSSLRRPGAESAETALPGHRPSDTMVRCATDRLAVEKAARTVVGESMSLIPKTTTPITKFIRTREGVLVFAINVALLVVPIVSSALTAEQAVKWAALVNGITVVSRTAFKIGAALHSATGSQTRRLNKGADAQSLQGRS